MRSRMIAASAGLAMVSWLPALPPLPSWLVLGVLALLLPFLWRARGLTGLLLACACGLLWSIAFAQWRLAAVLPPYLEGRDFWVTGLVTGLPQTGERSQQISFFVESSCFDLLPEDCPADNQVFRQRQILLNYYGPQRLVPGQRWFWRVRLSAPRGFANPGGFDYEAWLLQQGVAARGYVRDTSFNVPLEDGHAWLSRMRHAVRERLWQALEGSSHAAIIVALVLGDRDQVSAGDWHLFTQTGTNHLMVISGLHVGFAAWLCGALAAFFVRLSPSALLRLPAQQWGALAAMLGALGYSMLAGLSVPTQRACIMVLVFMGAQLYSRRVPHSFSFCLALLLVLVANPLSVLGAGLWLSFGAVGTLLLGLGGLQRLRQRADPPHLGHTPSRKPDSRRLWARWVRPQVIVFIGMMVPLAVWMQQVALLAPLANVLAIPLVSALVVPLCLLGAALLFVHVPLASAMLALADQLLGVLSFGLNALVGAPVPLVWAFRGTGVLEVALAVSGSVLLLMPRGWPGRWLGLILVLPLLVPSRAAPASGTAQLTVLDVGQGLAVVIRTASRTLVFDTGPRFSASFDAGAGIVVPYMRSVGVRHLDIVMVSHLDNDHRGGLAAVLASLSVEQVLTGASPDTAMRQAVQATRAALAMCTRGQVWEWDQVRFEVLWPPNGHHDAGNDSSCVLRVEAGGRVVLLTGDIEFAAESALVHADREPLGSHWLLAPHHGSQTSSSAAFIDAVAPRQVIYSAGYRSQFRHPAPAVAARYHARGVVAWSTALRGALQLCLGTQAQCPDAPQAWRETRRRWWHPVNSEASRQLHGELPEPLQPL